MAVQFVKFSGNNVVLNTAEFLGGSGILDENSISSQKAFKDINDRLLIATEVTDGLLSSEDKVKINNFQYDVLSRYEETLLAGSNTIDVGQPIVRLALYVDGILLAQDEYSFTENDTVITFAAPLGINSVVTAFFTNGLVANAVVDDAVTNTSNTYSSTKIETLIDDLGLTEAVLAVNATITVSKPIRKVINMYALNLGELTNANILSVVGNVITLTDSLDGVLIEVCYNA